MPGFVVLTALPSLHAAVLRGALEAEGFTVQLDRPTLGAVYGFDGGAWATRVLVPPDQLERARAVLAEFESDAEADAEADLPWDVAEGGAGDAEADLTWDGAEADLTWDGAEADAETDLPWDVAEGGVGDAADPDAGG